jgi:hypothetical protein
VKYFYNLNNCFLFEYILKCSLIYFCGQSWIFSIFTPGQYSSVSRDPSEMLFTATVLFTLFYNFFHCWLILIRDLQETNIGPPQYHVFAIKLFFAIRFFSKIRLIKETVHATSVPELVKNQLRSLCSEERLSDLHGHSEVINIFKHGSQKVAVVIRFKEALKPCISILLLLWLLLIVNKSKAFETIHFFFWFVMKMWPFPPFM